MCYVQYLDSNKVHFPIYQLELLDFLFFDLLSDLFMQSKLAPNLIESVCVIIRVRSIDHT